MNKTTALITNIILLVAISAGNVCAADISDMRERSKEWNSDIRQKMENIDKSRFKKDQKDLKKMLKDHPQRSPQDEEYKSHPRELRNSREGNTKSTNKNRQKDQNDDSGFYDY